MHVMVLSLLAGLAIAAAQAPQSQLPPAEVEQAIQAGSAAMSNQIGASLHESNPWSAWSRIQFGLTIHTPNTWIQYLASRAAFDGKPIQASDVADEDRAKSLRVFVRPAYLIRHVALVTPGERLPLQPIKVSGCYRLISFSAPGPDSMDANCTEYQFDWTEVLRRTDAGKREFDISVTAVGARPGLGGATREIRKNFRIKNDHLRKLGWAP